MEFFYALSESSTIGLSLPRTLVRSEHYSAFFGHNGYEGMHEGHHAVFFVVPGVLGDLFLFKPSACYQP
jgi:hypothetical protein